MKRCIVVFFLVLLWTISSVYANETGKKFSIGVLGGAQTYYGDIDEQQYKTFGKLALTYWFSDYFAMGLEGGTGFLKAKESELMQFKTNYYNGSLLMKFKLFPKNVTNFYLAGGGEYLSIDPKRLDNDPLPQLEDDSDFNKSQISVVGGGGMAFFLSERISLDLEALYHYVPSDYLDGLKEGSKADDYITAGIGLSIYLGKPKDTDGDGIPDKRDGDPEHPEDLDGFQDFDGIPDPDNDGDGVVDINDKCPGTDATIAAGTNTKEDIEGFQDEDGCPDPDNDGDGILDADDKCPGTDASITAGTNTKEDMDGFQDEDGCPDPDNDGDGIPDADDKCPNEPETVNKFEDEDGCPDENVGVKKGEAMVLEGVTFASGSANLTPNSMTILDKVVTNLKENPSVEVEIRGYTDNTGSYKGNVKISQMRADAVRSYLIQQGISFSRIKTMGFGPENPIAPNNTKEGRAKNRRIEFFRLK
ncbi:MAG: OmpA family protein [Calditrichaceae bacterium]|nr:OmpA family protein [Calditrichaceae bacterium]MBN2709370.1 OmpA family protein [Calditrichaceae bacterium]RQV95744.1 MAG: OmpA family protein [Calditrichota bacterium]